MEEPQHEESKEDISKRTLRLHERNKKKEENKEPLAAEEINRTLSQQLEGITLNEERTPKPETIKIPSTAPRTPKEPMMSLARSASETGKKEEASVKFAPKRYNGDRNLYQAFRDSVELYFLLEEKLTTDDKKIAFILSLLDEGEARTWRMNFIHKN